jgi:hypothetical protein
MTVPILKVAVRADDDLIPAMLALNAAGIPTLGPVITGSTAAPDSWTVVNRRVNG